MKKDIWGFDLDVSKRNLYIRWDISLWCNYNCSYCFYSDHRRNVVVKQIKSKNILDIIRFKKHKNIFGHSFDNFSAEKWVQKFKQIAKGRKLAIGITGGEPFLDKENFHYVLSKLIKMDEIDNIRIDTNGSFVVNNFKDLDCKKVYLNISYHPESTSIDKLISKVKEIQNVGMNVLMINYVMTPQNKDNYEEVYKKFAQIGVAVNPGVYYDVKNPENEKNYVNWYAKYLNEFDIVNKCSLIDLQGKVNCKFPQIGLVISYTGDIYNPCFQDKKLNLFKHNINMKKINNLLMNYSQKCPLKDCGCLQQYSFQEGCTRNQKSLNVLKNYVEDAIILKGND